MKVFVTGITGQLGHDVVKELIRRGHTAIGSGSTLTDDLLFPPQNKALWLRL